MKNTEVYSAGIMKNIEVYFAGIMKNTEVYFAGITKNLIVAEVQKLTGDITKFKWIPT